MATTRDELLTPPFIASYDFRIDDQVVGSFELTDDGTLIEQHTEFTDGPLQYSNYIGIRYSGSEVHAYRLDDGPWIELDHEGRYPTGAWPVLLRSGTPRYVAIDEGSGTETPRTLQREGSTVVEQQDGAVTRSFALGEGGTVTTITWGPTARSHLVRMTSRPA